MSTGGCPRAHDDAAYVLGALSPSERLAFERHLAACAECRESVRGLAGMPGLLARVPREVVESEPALEPLPETLLPRLLGEVRRTQRRRRWVAGLAAAAAVAVVGGAATTVAVVAGDDSEPPAAAPTTAAPEPMRQLDQDAVTASVSLTPVAWGTRLDLTCSYEAPAGYYQDDAPPTYSLVVRTADGDIEQVATWQGLPGKTMRITGATALVADQISAVEVRAGNGRPLLTTSG